MRGKEKLNPHAHRAGRWLGWLTVWSDPLHPSSRLLSPGCEFGVCEFGVWMERITPPPKKRLGKTENSIIRPQMPTPHPPLPESTLGTPDDAKDTKGVHSVAHSIRRPAIWSP